MQKHPTATPAPSSVIRPRQLPNVPWANGAGYTKEIAVGPPASGTGDYVWRLSLAELDRSSTFSPLPGIDRIFTLATTGPLTLEITGVEHHFERGTSACFPGETKVAASIIDDSPQLGLNLMVRRSLAGGDVAILQQSGGLLLDPKAGVVAATVLAGEAALADGRRLDALTTAVLGDAPEHIDTCNCILALAIVRPRLLQAHDAGPAGR